MLGQKDRSQPELFVAGSLRALLPDDHILVRVDRVLDLSWLRAEVSDCYSSDKGRPGIDPEVAVRLMLAGFLLGIVHDRRLMREAQVNLAIRWFTGYGLHEVLPDHSSLTRIRQRHRWRSEGFHGEAKTWHGLARAVRRGLQNMRIQALLTAAAINLKRLAAALLVLFVWVERFLIGGGRPGTHHRPCSSIRAAIAAGRA
jgi:Transposase domain (DUF772)/Transposase DDE domain